VTSCGRGFNILGGDDNIFHSNTVTGGSYGIYISSNSYNNTVMHNIIDDPGTGMWIERGKESLVYNNTFMNSGNGIEFRIDSTDNLITGNNFKDNTQAIKIEFNAGYNNITWNNFERNQYAIYGQGYYTHVIIAHNNITDSKNSGIYIDYWCSLIPCPQDNKIENVTIDSNLISNSTNYGIYLGRYVYNSTITRNNVVDNTNYGINVQGGILDTLFVNNTATGNGYGIYLTQYSSLYPANNTLYHNNLYNNTILQGYNYAYSTYNNDWNTTDRGNYWGSAYTGSDGDSDGIGDTPYSFSIGGYDYFPVMNRSDWEEYSPGYTLSFTPPGIPPEVEIPDASGSTTGGESSIWSRELTVDVVDALNVTSDVGTLGVTGKQYLLSTLCTANGQILSRRLWSFYIVEGEIYLVLETDREEYKPGENITISFEAGNWGAEEKNLTLTLTRDSPGTTPSSTMPTSPWAPARTTRARRSSPPTRPSPSRALWTASQSQTRSRSSSPCSTRR